MRVQSLLVQLPQDDPDYTHNMGCLLYQDGKHEEACRMFTSVLQLMGSVPCTLERLRASLLNLMVCENGATTDIHIVSLPVLFVAPPALSYNIALCHYSLKNYNQAVKYIEEIIERGIREHPGAAAL